MEWYIYLLRAVIVAIAIGALAVVLKLISQILLQQETAKLLHGDRHRPGLIHRIIRISNPDTVLMRDLQFPVESGNEATGKMRVPLIAVNRGGVILITTCFESGKIDNPYRGDWVAYQDDGAGVPFQNPFEMNDTYRQILSMVFEREQIENIPFQSIAVFAARGVKFRHRTEMLITADKLGDLVHDIGKNRFLSRREMKKAIAILKKNGIPSSKKNQSPEANKGSL